jgi:hypothetical protein
MLPRFFYVRENGKISAGLLTLTAIQHRVFLALMRQGITRASIGADEATRKMPVLPMDSAAWPSKL